MTLTALYQLFLEHPNITTDSRKIEAGCIFFALKGDHFNGNVFALQAIGQGAAYAIVDEEQYANDEKIILVKDVLTTLQELARMHRQQTGIPVLAITGTNGKTTTKELVAAVLATKYNLLYTKGNLNNHIGVPLTLLSIRKDTEMAVIEMGANHPGEIDMLCNIAEPDFGLITNVGKAHLEGFGSLEGVINTKTELYRFLEKRNGTIFINEANMLLTPHTGNATTVGYSSDRGGKGLEGEVVNAAPHLVVKAMFPKGWHYIRTQLAGRYNLENVLAAAAVGLYFEVDPLKIVQALESYKPENNRSQMLQTASNLLLLDAYNANPSSTLAALENFGQLENLSKGVILGDMLELGNEAVIEHQKIVDFLGKMNLSLIYLVGFHYNSTAHPDRFHCFQDAESLRKHLHENKLTGCLLLVKGSRGMKLESILPEL